MRLSSIPRPTSIWRPRASSFRPSASRVRSALACSRAIVAADVYDQIVEKVVALTRATVTAGQALKGDVTVGAVVDASQYRKILDYIESGKQETRLVYGGEKGEGNGYFIQPTIFADVAPTAKVGCEEIFGPVLSIIKADDFDDALRIANDTEYGLRSTTRATASISNARAASSRSAISILNRKCTGALMGVHPFGGRKLSGTDAKGGSPDTLLHFLEAKAVGERL